jgi:hypothetical protein
MKYESPRNSQGFTKQAPRLSSPSKTTFRSPSIGRPGPPLIRPSSRGNPPRSSRRETAWPRLRSTRRSCYPGEYRPLELQSACTPPRRPRPRQPTKVLAAARIVVACSKMSSSLPPARPASDPSRAADGPAPPRSRGPRSGTGPASFSLKRSTSCHASVRRGLSCQTVETFHSRCPFHLVQNKRGPAHCTDAKPGDTGRNQDRVR